MGSRVRVPSRPLLNFKNPCNSIDYRVFLVLVGHIVADINYHLKSKSLIGDHVKHLPYEKSASIYVSKFICDEKTNYNLIKNS